MEATSDDGRVPDLALRDVTKRYGGILAVDNVSLNVSHGEVIALLGPSGSGKTSLLMLIGGQIHPDHGTIQIAGLSVEKLPPNKIDTATVFQDYALFPHMTVGENVAFGLQVRRMPPENIAKKVAEVLALVGLEGFESRNVTKLSGGQRQRVATARALVVQPRVLLMDEPLSALDLQIRSRLQRELRDLLKRVNVTTIIVTHDQKEAFALADRVAVMNAGKIEQVGRPADLYRNPATPFVARFIGSGVLLEAVVLRTESATSTVLLAGQQIQVRGRAKIDERVLVMLRPEDVTLEPDGNGFEVTWSGARIRDVTESGEVTRYTVDVNGIEIVALELGIARFNPADSVAVSIAPDRAVVINQAEISVEGHSRCIT